MDDSTPAQPPRKPRADKVRNRDRVLEAAKAVFAAGGPGGSLEAVARQAGVGVGTVYRHFPTRQDLFEAVYRREVEHLVELAEQLAADQPPLEALRRWMHANVEFVATKKGMSAALAIAASGSSNLTIYSMDRLSRAVDVLLRRAAEAEAIRADISPEDILRTIVGLCYTHDNPGWQPKVLRLVDVFLDGMRIGPVRRLGPPRGVPPSPQAETPSRPLPLREGVGGGNVRDGTNPAHEQRPKRTLLDRTPRVVPPPPSPLPQGEGETARSPLRAKETPTRPLPLREGVGGGNVRDGTNPAHEQRPKRTLLDRTPRTVPPPPSPLPQGEEETARSPLPAKETPSRPLPLREGVGGGNAKDRTLLAHARAMRKSPTPAERRLWQAIRNNALGAAFRRQSPVGSYIVDFFCPASRLVIEVDGDSHAAPDADTRRDAWLHAQGLRVAHFWNNEVLTNLDGVLAEILRLIAAGAT